MKRRGRGILWTGLGLLGMMGLAALAAPLLAPFDPSEIDLGSRLLGPSARHRLGTDQLGRDIFTRMLYGAQVSLSVGVVAVGLATVVGGLIGAVAGYRGGRTDAFLMRMVDILLCFPSVFLILAAVAFVGPSAFNLMLILGLTGWTGLARLVRAEALSLKEREFILAARAIGASEPRILLRHLLPNALAPVLVHASLGVASAILIESALSFLGIGIQPTVQSWGNILAAGKAPLGYAWWLPVAPGSAAFLTVLGCNLLGEGLRRQWEPH